MNEKTGQNQENPTQIIQIMRNKALYTGFIGGIMWSSFGTLLYYLNFTEVNHKSFTLKSWIDASWIDTALGTIISIILIGLLSIVVAFLYYVACKQVKSIWMSIIYGAILWGAVFYFLHPIFNNVPSIQKLETSSIISTLCLYVLYSVFIGYTISYDYANYNYKKEKK